LRSNTRTVLVVSLLAVFVLAGCAPGAAQNTSAAAKALEGHLQALTSKNEDAFSHSLCPAWEGQAFLEFDAYQGVDVKLSDLACSSASSKPGEAQATCQGSILFSYGSEQQRVDLSRRVYTVALRGESWQVCGFLEREAGTAGSR